MIAYGIFEGKRIVTTRHGQKDADFEVLTGATHPQHLKFGTLSNRPVQVNASIFNQFYCRWVMPSKANSSRDEIASSQSLLAMTFFWYTRSARDVVPFVLEILPQHERAWNT